MSKRRPPVQEFVAPVQGASPDASVRPVVVFDQNDTPETVVQKNLGALLPISPTPPTPADLDGNAGGDYPTSADVLDFQTQEARKEDPIAIDVQGMAGTDPFIKPVCDPDLMYRIYLRSAFLAPIIEAMVHNVYTAGFRLTPYADPTEEEGVAKIQRSLSYRAGRPVAGTELSTAIDQIRWMMDMEYERLEAWFRNCCSDMTYAELMALTGQDLEITGNAYWEVLRDSSGAASRLVWVQARTCRATLLERTLVPTQQLARISTLDWGYVPQQRRYRKYLQIHAQGPVARFKELGDPRWMSRNSGIFYSTRDEMLKVEAGGRKRRDPNAVLPATEVLHLRLPYAGSPIYGSPPWAGNYPALQGSRELDEENLKLASDNGVPNVMLLVTGGRVGADDIERISQQIEARRAGHKQMVLVQAMSDQRAGMSGPTATPTIKVERMRSEQNEDALYQKYDLRNEDKTDGCWRFPKAALGKSTKGQTRESDMAARRFTEDQVYDPRRTTIDEQINSKLMPLAGARLHRYVSAARQPRDTDAIIKLITDLLEKGTLTPNESRDMAEHVMQRKLPRIPELWADLPPRTLTAILQTKNHVTAAALLSADKTALGALATSLADSLAQRAQSPGRDPATEADGPKNGGPVPPPVGHLPQLTAPSATNAAAEETRLLPVQAGVDDVGQT